MNSESRISVPRSTLALAGAALFAVGAGAGYAVVASAYRTAPPGSAAAPAAAPAASPPAAAAPATAPRIAVPMSPEARRRAGIVLTPVRRGAPGGAVVQAPGVVEADAYRRVAVTPIVGGRIVAVPIVLGDRVVRGQTIARLLSPELAEAQAMYVSARAELEAHDRELARTERLVQLGSASRQELERTTAEHTSRRTAVQSAAARLRLLGLTDETVEHLGAGHVATSAVLEVPAPLGGIVIERPATVGANVDPATPLATIADLSHVWVVADIYEADFARVRVGTPATIAVAAYPQLSLAGKVGYVDAQVRPDTRTAKVRVEVENPRQELKLGMLAEARFAVDPAGSAIVIPRRAIQTIGDRHVVYVADPGNDRELVERTVRLGDGTGEAVAVLAGLDAGDAVVSEGSFHVRAERERLGLGEPAPEPAPEPSPAAAPGPPPAGPVPESVTIRVTKDGFSPATVTVHAGAPVRLTFLRTTDQTCAKEIVVPSLKIRRPLPLDQPVVVTFTPAKAGSVDFVCGMGMLKGAVVVAP